MRAPLEPAPAAKDPAPTTASSAASSAAPENPFSAAPDTNGGFDVDDRTADRPRSHASRSRSDAGSSFDPSESYRDGDDDDDSDLGSEGDSEDSGFF